MSKWPKAWEPLATYRRTDRKRSKTWLNIYRASWLSRVMNLIFILPVSVLILWWPSSLLSFPLLVSTAKLLSMPLPNDFWFQSAPETEKASLCVSHFSWSYFIVNRIRSVEKHWHDTKLSFRTRMYYWLGKAVLDDRMSVLFRSKIKLLSKT